MCDPLTIGSIVLTGAGIAANSAASSRVQGARDDVLAAERIRQQGFDRQADALNAQSQDRYQGFDQQQDQKATQIGDYFKTQAESGPAPISAPEAIPTSTSNIVTRENAKQAGKTAAFSGQQDSALGNLRAFGDLLGGIGREQARDASLIGQIGGFKTGSANVVPLELDNASHAGDGLSTLGQLAGGFGSLGISAGLSGKSLGNLFGKAATVGPTGIAPAIAQAPSAAWSRAGAGNPFRLY